jgi:hypothetical protein
VEEGLEITEAVRERYRGHNRNPYAEIESGCYYARALSSWSVFLAMSGFQYDGSRHIISFDPVKGSGDFSSFWSCGTGWGNFRRKGPEISLEVDYGELLLETFGIGGSGREVPDRLTLNGKEIPCEWDPSSRHAQLINPVLLRTNDRIQLSLINE